MDEHGELPQEHPEDEAVKREAERWLWAQLQIGSDMEAFLASDAGRYLKGVALQEISEAVRIFLDHDTRRSIDQVAAAHAKAMRARQSFHWMLEAIQAGRVADYNLRQLDDHEERL
jgi:phosphomannomutase